MSHDVFISYKSEEYKEASWVKQRLTENGLICWMAPDCIPGGSSYAEEITNAIKNCQAFVLVLSTRAQQSKFVKKELDLAINCDKPILPFMMEECEMQGAFSFYLTDVQHYYAFQNKEGELKRMVNRINGLCGKQIDLPSPEMSSTPVSENPVVPMSFPPEVPVNPMPEPSATPLAKPKTNRLCLISLILGIVGLILGMVFLLFGIMGIPTLVLAGIGKKQIKTTGESGKGMAIAGIVLGIIDCFYLLLLLI